MKINYEIVIAHYNEDLERIKPYAENAIIYHKGSDDFPKIKCKKWIKLPNIGRESHTYLYHIVNNYDNLPHYTFFFQWWIEDHIEAWYVYPSFNNYMDEVKKHWFSCAQLFFLIKKNPQIVYSQKFLDMIKSGSLKKSEYTFASFYKKLLNKNQKLLTPCFLAANFWISNDLIRGRKFSFYKRALDLLPEHPNPEEWHFYERLRFSIFNKHYNLHIVHKLFKFHVRLYKNMIKEKIFQ